MSKLSDAARAEIAEAVRIVKEDKAKATEKDKVPEETPPAPTEGSPPPVKDEPAPEPVKKSLWWGDRR